MKAHDRNQVSLSLRGNRNGIALIIVLASVVLLTVLIVAFLSSVGTELKSSRVYANGSSVKLLAQSAVNMVQSEINDATHDGSLCWTSQPGMIRTFDNTGAPKQYFKLYSDSAMVGTGKFDSTAGVPPATWYNLAGIYVDLNQPVSTMNGATTTYHFPIVDGLKTDFTNYTPSAAIGTVQALSPINATSNTPQVAGFWINPNAPLQANTVNQAPMPVKWLYVLKDGSVISPDSLLTSGATTFKNSGTTPDNNLKQIVGRIAFWTDDETAKVNINTAGEGAAIWDTPRFALSDVPTGSNHTQATLSTSQPVQDEFQRYPGHPATVSLSAVFGNLVTDGSSYPENIYPLTPRISSGGSLHGTIVTNASGLQPMKLRTDRLYDTVDEFMFQNNRAFNSALLSSPSSLDQAKIEQAKFFLTASSHAPDVNLFNRPRVSMWPVSSAGTALPNRSPKDQLIAFCTTVGGFGYYFQRQDANDPYTDLPGTQASDGTATGLGHNRQLLEYLRNLLNQPIPGFGGSLAAKYSSTDTISGSGVTGKEIDQILTETFDYIRSTNVKDQSLATSSGNPVTTYTSPQIVTNGSIPLKDAGGGTLYNGYGQVVPIVDQSNGTRGFGRFPTLQQAALIFYACADDGKTPYPASASATQMKAFFVLQFFDPAMGYPWVYPCYRIGISGLDGFKWDSTTPMGFSSSFILPNPRNDFWNNHPMVGGVEGWRRLVYGASPTSTNGLQNLFSAPYPTNSTVAFAKATPPITGINFKGGPVTVTIYKNSNGFDPANPGTPLQTIKFTMPSAPVGGFPLPALSPAPPSGSSIPHHVPAWENWGNRWAAESENGNFGEIISNNDVIRAVVATPGDVRLIAARAKIDDSTGFKLFNAHPLYMDGTGTENMAHNLQESYGQTERHASMTATHSGGLLVPLTSAYYYGFALNDYGGAFGNNYGCEYQGMYQGCFWSDVPTTSGVFVGGAGSVPGDWDNGVPNLRDGAYINKPDEGDNTLQGYTYGGDYPYMSGYYTNDVGQTFFSPNRMIPSPGMLGSLSTGVLGNKPWQTLLFRPGPAGHPGLGTSASGSGDTGPPYTTPPDHLLMDLFTMPVVEPYAISEPLATAGRINMNYQIIPFTYITRNTGIQAALKGTQVIAVPDADAGIYKFGYMGTLPTASAPYRLNLDMMTTLTQFDARFNNNDVFRSPTEICSIDLVPSNYTGAVPPTRSSMDTYWSTHRLTGDNSRERPYANLYPLLTTRSNTFTVHFRVQTLKKIKTASTDYTVWQEGTDLVTGEYRGSETIERYVDANGAVDANGNPLPNFAAPYSYTQTPPLTLAPFYKFRVVSTRQFAP